MLLESSNNSRVFDQADKKAPEKADNALSRCEADQKAEEVELIALSLKHICIKAVIIAVFPW